MQKKIQSALISVYYKDGLEKIIRLLKEHQVTIYTTGGTQKFIEAAGVPCVAVETLTSYPSILGGRVKTLHPSVFGGILGRRDQETDRAEMKQYAIPEIDLVIVDLYPFEETVAATADEQRIIEKIDIGGPSMIRAAAKNHASVVVVADKKDYPALEQVLSAQDGITSPEERRKFAARAFDVCTGYDIAISNYFNGTAFPNPFSAAKKILRYGENPHQQAFFSGDLDAMFDQLHGKELSYNNLVDVDAAVQVLLEFPLQDDGITFAVIKHTNVCGISRRTTVREAFDGALAGDPESAFGGVWITNSRVDASTAEAMNGLFFEVLIAPDFEAEALNVLQSKKNRILLRNRNATVPRQQSRTVLNGILSQDSDRTNFSTWEEAGGRTASANEKEDLFFANLVCKHLKSNAIAIVKNGQLIGKGCGQTSRIDAMRQAIDKARQFNFDLNGAVVASDAFFPFDDCVRMGNEAGIRAFIQPGGSIRDKDSVEYCRQHGLVLVMTGTRHFKH